MGRPGASLRSASTEMACRLAAPFGSLVLRVHDDVVAGVDLSLDPCTVCEEAQTPLLKEATRQFERYFADGSFSFSLPLAMAGTLHQQRVWGALERIPSGQCVSYRDLAQALGSSPRAVAGACRSNPLPLLIACHRVVGSNGWGGYCGYTQGRWLEVKQWLLNHERISASAAR